MARPWATVQLLERGKVQTRWTMREGEQHSVTGIEPGWHLELVSAGPDLESPEPSLCAWCVSMTLQSHAGASDMRLARPSDGESPWLSPVGAIEAMLEGREVAAFGGTIFTGRPVT